VFANARDTRYHRAKHQWGADGIRSALLADERVVAMEAVRDAGADDDNEYFRDPVYDSGGEDDDRPADAE
jgi:hypothetical protein